MPPLAADFDKLIYEALLRDFSGWDFSYLDGRMIEAAPPWDYRALVYERSRDIQSLLDMGTGGGELLSSLQPFPPDTCATEGYPLNIPIALKRLEPLGVHVVEFQRDDALPFNDERFDLIINRHESYWEPEIYRLLKPGGLFITQQVGGMNLFGLNELLQDHPRHEFSYWTPDYAQPRLEQAGLGIVERQEAFPETVFTDIGAVVYYLKAIPWQLGDFDVERYHDRLGVLHNIILEGKLALQSHRFLLIAQKPPLEQPSLIAAPDLSQEEAPQTPAGANDTPDGE